MVKIYKVSQLQEEEENKKLFSVDLMKYCQTRKKSMSDQMTKEEHLKRIQEKHFEFLSVEKDLKQKVEELKKLETEYWAKHGEYTEEEVRLLSRLDEIEKELKEVVENNFLSDSFEVLKKEMF